MIGFFATIGTLSLQQDLQRLLNDSSLTGARVGIYVKRFQGEEFITKSPDTLLIPASTMKLVPATLAFEKLGADYTPLTIAWKTGDVIRIVGGGDPAASTSGLQLMAKALGAKPTDKVEFDDGLFGREFFAPGWGAKEKSYCPPISALMTNRARMEIWAQAGKVWAKPHAYGVKIVGAPKTGAGTVTVRWTVPGREAKIGGAMAKGAKAKLVASFVLPDPGAAAAAVFGNNVTRKPLGKLPFDVIPPSGSGKVTTYDVGATKVAVLRGASVNELAARSLTESDNYLAEVLLKLCGGAAGVSGSWGDSISLAHEFLVNAGLRPDGFVLSDGSGLSRNNRLSARVLATLIERDLLTSYGEQFLKCMAVPGKGTLKNRFKGLKLWAKTGTLNGVVTLAGVAQPSDTKRYIFAILINGGSGPASQQRLVVDKIIGALYK